MIAARLRRIRIDLAYDGTEYAGWQIQNDVRTVQGTLEEALTRLSGGRATRVSGAGRTDAGVHARGQVAACALDASWSDDDLAHALRGMLPGDLRVLAVRGISASFDPQRDAVSKTYRYRIDRSPAGDPFLARFALHHPHPADTAAIRNALARLPGRRDWSGFTGSACEVHDRVRTLLEARLDEEPACQTCTFTFRADGFLTHMVRNLVGTLVEVGRGRFAPGRIDEILGAGDRRLAGPTAPAHGLVLWRVHYPDDDAPMLHNPLFEVNA